MHLDKYKTSKISEIDQPILNVSPTVCKVNGLFNKQYGDDLDSSGRSQGLECIL